MADQRNGLGTPGQPDLPLNVAGAGAGRKVAIPRLPKPEGSVRSGLVKEQALAKDKNRVSHACEPCRQRKTKCSGERPICRHCEDFRITCYYGDGKRDRAKNEMLTLQNKVEYYEKLLEQLSQELGGPSRDTIYKALGKVANPLSSGTSGNGGENSTSTNGSTDPFARDQDDIFTRPSDRKGTKVGIPPDVSLSLTRNSSKDGTESSLEIVSPTAGRKEGATAAPIIQDANFLTAEMVLETPTSHLDDLDLSLVGDHVDPFDLPTKVAADVLIKNYFETVQPMFPILLKKLFMKQYESFYKFQFTPESSKRWLAILNAIFAIGAVYSYMVDPENPRNEQVHIQFFTRARILALDGGAVYEVADLQQIQVAGLMGIYLVSTSQNNRAWKITGLAIRYAQTLGLHLRTDSNRIPEAEKEMRVRIWYAINCLDKHLAFMTGRPPVIKDNECTVSMPKPMEDEALLPENIVMKARIPSGDAPEGDLTTTHGMRPNYSSTLSDSASYLAPSTPGTSIPPAIIYFTEYARISKITVEALSFLHCPETMMLSWLEVQQKISDLDKSLKIWKAGLPPILDFIRPHRDQTLTRQRMSLALQYYHTRLIMNRPCLCRRNVRGITETSDTRIFNRNAALACIESARETLKLLPSVRNSPNFYRIAPWWCLFHYLVSAGNVIIVEIAMTPEHNSRQTGTLLDDARKLICWLKALGQQNATARRAYDILSKLLTVTVPKLKYVADDTTNSDSASPMVGVEATQAGFVPALTASHSGNQAYDELPATWEMFPTPQQMHEIDIEDDLRRRDSIIAQQQPKRPQQTPVYVEGYFPPQWDPLDTMDTVLGKRPFGYIPPAGATEGEYPALAPDIQPSLRQGEAQLDGITTDVQLDGIDSIGGSADTPDGTEDSTSSSPPSISSFPPTSRGQVTYHKKVREEFRRHSQVGSGQVQQLQQHHDRSKKRRESPS